MVESQRQAVAQHLSGKDLPKEVGFLTGKRSRRQLHVRAASLSVWTVSASFFRAQIGDYGGRRPRLLDRAQSPSDCILSNEREATALVAAHTGCCVHQPGAQPCLLLPTLVDSPSEAIPDRASPNVNHILRPSIASCARCYYCVSKSTESGRIS